jgi:hypothetical protein
MADEDEVNGRVYESVEDMLAADDVEYALVDGWKGQIRIGSLTAGDMIEWNEANEGEAKRTAGLRLIVKSLVNSTGKRIGTEKHIPLLRAKSHKVIDHIVREVLKLNGLTPPAEAPSKKG